MIRILVTGANGQVGKCFREIVKDYPQFQMDLFNHSDLDITHISSIKKAFATNAYDYCVNLAAFTDVEQAEIFPVAAFKINASGVHNLVSVCKKKATVLIHISTDYVFDGEKKSPYLVTDAPNPVNEYGRSKLEGEKIILENLQKFFIIRSSWIYSEHGHNFYTKILEKARNKEKIIVTDAQIGCPTNAGNLVKYILQIIESGNTNYGIYHFTDGEPMTWYAFAEKILKENGFSEASEKLIKGDYKTLARRPVNSVLM